MKNPFILALLISCVSITVAMAQTKKTTTPTKKPTTTVKSSAPQTSNPKKTTTTTSPVVSPPVVEQNKTTTTTTPTQNTTTPSTTTTIQSSGPSKGKNNSEPKPERVREPKPEKVKTPRVPNGSSGGVKFGIRAEATQIVTFEQGGSSGIAPGVNAGLIVNIPFSEKVSIQPEVLFSMQTFKISNSGTSDYVKATGNSILAPVILNLNLGRSSTKFMVNLGGYAEYALSASTEQSINGDKLSKTIDLSGMDKFSYGTVVGLGVKLNNNFLIEARSFYDLKTSNNKTIVATLGIGYLF